MEILITLGIILLSVLIGLCSSLLVYTIRLNRYIPQMLQTIIGLNNHIINTLQSSITKQPTNLHPPIDKE